MPKVSLPVLEIINELSEQYRADYPDVSIKDFKYDANFSKHKQINFADLAKRMQSWRKLDVLCRQDVSHEDMVDVSVDKLDELMTFYFLNGDANYLRTALNLYKVATPEEQIRGIILVMTFISPHKMHHINSMVKMFVKASEKIEKGDFILANFLRECNINIHNIKDFHFSDDILKVSDKDANGISFLKRMQNALLEINLIQDLYITKLIEILKNNPNILCKNGQSVLSNLLDIEYLDVNVIGNILSRGLNIEGVHNVMHQVALGFMDSSKKHEKDRSSKSSYSFVASDLQDMRNKFCVLVANGVGVDESTMRAMRGNENGCRAILSSLWNSLELSSSEDAFMKKAKFIRDERIKDVYRKVDSTSIFDRSMNKVIAAKKVVDVINKNHKFTIYSIEKTRKDIEDMKNIKFNKWKNLMLDILTDKEKFINERLSIAKKDIQSIVDGGDDFNDVQFISNICDNFNRHWLVCEKNILFVKNIITYYKDLEYDDRARNEMLRIVEYAIKESDDKEMITAVIMECPEIVVDILSKEEIPRKTLALIDKVAKEKDRDDIAASAEELILSSLRREDSRFVDTSFKDLHHMLNVEKKSLHHTQSKNDSSQLKKEQKRQI